jgi:hypothetical protein
MRRSGSTYTPWNDDFVRKSTTGGLALQAHYPMSCLSHGGVRECCLGEHAWVVLASPGNTPGTIYVRYNSKTSRDSSSIRDGVGIVVRMSGRKVAAVIGSPRSGSQCQDDP